MRIAIITDTHFGEKNNHSKFLAHYKRFLEEQFFPTIKKQGIKYVFHGGDLFHNRQSIDVRAWQWTQRNFLDPLEDMGVTMYGVVGNHDAFYKSSLEINSPQEFLRHYSNFHFLSEPGTVNIGGVSFLLIPWIHSRNKDQVVQAITDSEADYLIGHLELAGFQMHPGVYSESGNGIEALLQKFKGVWSGHYHTQSQKGNIRYLGSPIEFNWNDVNDSKGFHVYDTESDHLKFFKNKDLIHHKVYMGADSDPIDATQYRDKIVRLIITEKVKRAKIDATIAALNEECWDLKVVDHGIDDAFINASEEEYGEGKSTLEIIDETVREVETDLDQDRLAHFIKTLYTEAEAIR